MGVIAMDMLKGPTLADALEVAGPIERNRLIAEYGKLLAKVHVLMKVQHGDFHANNVLLDKQGTLKVIDFERAIPVSRSAQAYVADILLCIKNASIFQSADPTMLSDIDVMQLVLAGYQQGLDEAGQQKVPLSIPSPEKSAMEKAMNQARELTLGRSSRPLD